MINARSVQTALLVIAMMTLSSCMNVTRTLNNFPELFNPPVNATEYNYAAADAMVGQAKADISLNDPILIGVLHPVNLKANEKVPPFGKVTADQLGTRLVQLGYNVMDLGQTVEQASSETERTFLTHASDRGAAMIITGNYTISDYDILINARLVNVKSGRVIASIDYRMPLGRDTYQMLGRDPFFNLPQKTVMNPDAALPGKPLPSADLPVRIVPE